MRSHLKLSDTQNLKSFYQMKNPHALLLLLLAMVNAMACSGSKVRNTETQDTTMEKTIRPTAVAGSFYPRGREEVEEQLKDCFKPFTGCEQRTDIQAVIVPHAGWVFSGEVAASAFARILPSKHYERVFLIGPSHQVWLDAVSVNTAVTHYATPLGEVPVDIEACRKLTARNPELFKYDPRAHAREHCLEVEIPFLQYHLKEMPPIVPVIISTDEFDKLVDLNEALAPWFNELNLFVISSDFSHYPAYKDALLADGRTGEAIESGNVQMLANAIDRNTRERITGLATSACGSSGLFTLLIYTQRNPQLHVEHVLYRNSGDSPYGEKDRVVGYHSYIVYPQPQDSSAYTLTASEKQTLLQLARTSITDSLNRRPTSTSHLSEKLMAPLGAFVTLYKNGRLRGCIGHFGEDIPLGKTVVEMARSAAFGDPRFPSVTANELKDIEIEISVLTPLKRIHDISEFHYGRQGIYMRQGYRSGTFLPQVAYEVDWTKEEFLGHCAQDKAGIGWYGWKDAELYTYEAILFSEE